MKKISIACVLFIFALLLGIKAEIPREHCVNLLLGRSMRTNWTKDYRKFPTQGKYGKGPWISSKIDDLCRGNKCGSCSLSCCFPCLYPYARFLVDINDAYTVSCPRGTAAVQFFCKLHIVGQQFSWIPENVSGKSLSMRPANSLWLPCPFWDTSPCSSPSSVQKCRNCLSKCGHWGATGKTLEGLSICIDQLKLPSMYQCQKGSLGQRPKQTHLCPSLQCIPASCRHMQPPQLVRYALW